MSQNKFLLVKNSISELLVSSDMKEDRIKLMELLINIEHIEDLYNHLKNKKVNNQVFIPLSEKDNDNLPLEILSALEESNTKIVYYDNVESKLEH